jgi:hypothetical protein
MSQMKVAGMCSDMQRQRERFAKSVFEHEKAHASSQERCGQESPSVPAQVGRCCLGLLPKFDTLLCSGASADQEKRLTD